MANWHYMTTGSACVVQIKIDPKIPTIPGSLKTDMLKVGVNNNFKDYLNKVWKNTWINKYYSTLSPKSVINSQLAYTFCGAYNNGTTYAGNISYELEVSTNVNDCYEYYVGSNVYFICRASHRHGYLSNYTGICTITVTYTDGSTYQKVLHNIYENETHWLNDTPSDMVHISEKLPKPIRKVHVSAYYPNAGAQWHDVGSDRTWYRNWIINRGANSFAGNFVGNYHLENKINFLAYSGYSIRRVESAVININ